MAPQRKPAGKEARSRKVRSFSPGNRTAGQTRGESVHHTLCYNKAAETGQHIPVGITATDSTRDLARET